MFQCLHKALQDINFSFFVRGIVLWRSTFSPSSARGHGSLLADVEAQDISHPAFNLNLSLVAGCSLWWLPGLLTCGSPLKISVSKVGRMVWFHTDAGFTEPLRWHFPREFCALYHYGDDWVCQGREEKRPLGSLLRGPPGDIIKIPFDIGFSSSFWGVVLGWGKGAQLLAFLAKHLEYFSENPCDTFFISPWQLELGFIRKLGYKAGSKFSFSSLSFSSLVVIYLAPWSDWGQPVSHGRPEGHDYCYGIRDISCH